MRYWTIDLENQQLDRSRDQRMQLQEVMEEQRRAAVFR